MSHVNEFHNGSVTINVNGRIIKEDEGPEGGVSFIPHPRKHPDLLAWPVWCALASRAEWSHGGRLGRCSLTQTELAAAAHLSVPSVCKALDSLAKSGLLIVTHVMSGKRYMSTLYTLTPMGLGLEKAA